MKQTFWLFIAVVFLFGAAVVHGEAAEGTLQDVDCSNAGSISFSISIPDIAEWIGEESSWRLNNQQGCEPTFNQSTGLVEYSGINVAACDPDDPSSTPDNSKFEYEFVISVDATAGSAISPVTFAYDHYYVVKCFYNKEQEGIMASFQPRHSLTDSGSAVADFIIEFTVHEVENGNEVTSIIDLRTAVYGKLKISGDGNIPQGLDIHLRAVTADGDNNLGGNFALIDKGCAVSDIVTDTSCSDNEEDRFDFDIFRFPGQTTGDLVHLTAKVIVCLTSNTGSVCRSECNACSSGRKRRETLEEIQRTEFYVTAGPFKIRDPDQESETPADKDEGTALPAYMIAVMAVCGLLVVAIVSAVVLIVLRRGHKNLGNAELQNEDSVTA